MADYKTITARVPGELKSNIDLYKINASELIWKAVEEEIRLQEDKKLGHPLEDFQKQMKKNPVATITAMLREDRNSRWIFLYSVPVKTHDFSQQRIFNI